MKQSESQEQQALFQWAAVMEGKYPELKRLHHIPNGGKRDIRTAKRLKAEGVKPGVPDIFLPVPRHGFHGLYIEMKADKSCKTTDNQDDWIEFLNEQGYRAIVCHGWDEASKEILEYLGG